MLAVLQREHALLRSLLDSIDLELRALQDSDPSAIESAAATKNQYTQELAEHDERRRTLLRQSGFTEGASGIERLIHRCGPDRARLLRQAWQELLTLSQRCYEGNARNGQLNVVAQRMVRQMLAHLRGESTRSEVYDRDGRVAASDPKALGRV